MDITEEIKATAFKLVDSQGRSRASLHLSQDGRPRLEMYDSRGVARLGLGIGLGEHPTMSVADAQGQLRMSLATNPDGSFGMAILGEGELPRLLLSHAGDNCGVTLYDPEGNIRFMALTNRELSRVTILDKDGNQCWSSP